MTSEVSKAQILKIDRGGYHLYAEAIAPQSDTAPWIIFGNSLVTDITLWDAQAAALADRYGILRYDQAGHGKSTVPMQPIDFDDLGSDLLAVMDAAGVARASYVGVSMGVPTGLAAHKMAADRFAALVLCDGQARTAPGGAAGWVDRIEMAEASGMEAFAAATVDRWLTSGTGAERRQELAKMIAATPLDGFRACATALMNYDYADELARITCPTLLIAGAEDGAIPEGMATKLKHAIAQAKMQIIERAGHVPCYEQPDAFTAMLSDFLETTLKGVAA